MSKPILNHLRSPRAPQSLKQIVLTSCSKAFTEPIQAENVATANWFDRCLQLTAGVAVFLFVLTCFASFVTDSTQIASARFSSLDVKRVNVQNKAGNNSSFIVLRRQQSWP